ncbi:TatD family hydrolase [candidate division KSB1 bacterium]|nr:TatD family hydrolase [candidate division KSB1 bacterium]
MAFENIIDSHAHLDFKNFHADRAAVIQRAQEVGVTHIINVGTNLATSRFSVDLAGTNSVVFAAIGIHPHDALEATRENMDALRTMYQMPKVVAIGEIGLDYYKMYQAIDVQRRAFKAQVELALDLGAPLIIHSRSADTETLEILQDYQFRGWRGVFHCFPGDERMAEQVLEMGFCISFTGVITFKKAHAAAVVQKIPLERLLLETDCPFMTPEPHRGQRNEPAYVHFIGQKMAELKQVPFSKVAQQTTANATQLFGFKGACEHAGTD